jgi:predicted ester cyclase
MNTEDNKQVVVRFDALLGADDLTELNELCAVDMVNHTLAPGRPQGLAGTREFLETMGRSSFRDQSWDELTVVAEGSYVVQFGKRGGQWPGGMFSGIDAPAGPYSRDFMAAFRFSDGRIAERWAIRDDLGMLRQLGAI